MHMICSSMLIPALTKLTEFFYILCRKKLPHPFWRPLSAGSRGHMLPLPPLAFYLFLYGYNDVCLSHLNKVRLIYTFGSPQMVQFSQS